MPRIIPWLTLVYFFLGSGVILKSLLHRIMPYYQEQREARTFMFSSTREEMRPCSETLTLFDYTFWLIPPLLTLFSELPLGSRRSEPFCFFGVPEFE